MKWTLRKKASGRFSVRFYLVKKEKKKKKTLDTFKKAAKLQKQYYFTIIINFELQPNSYISAYDIHDNVKLILYDQCFCNQY